ncbi:MAG: hypothetical protein O7B32_03240 [Thaumarchaeota archaeon]|nr:hypothetical protein [Nitrososphaerota archaeon]
MIAVPKNVLPDVALTAAMTVVKVDNISRYLERLLYLAIMQRPRLTSR